MVALVGNTPMVELESFNKKQTRIFAKLEGMNIGGSIKDRIGYWLIFDAMVHGKLTKGQTIIEATSGNTGIGLAIGSLYYGFKCHLLVPQTTAKEKILSMKAYGAEVDVIHGDIDDCIGLVEVMTNKSDRYVWLNQYDNPASIECHYKTTGPEIYRWMNKNIPMFDSYQILVCAMGTTGTIMGLSKYLKPKGWTIVGVMPNRGSKIEGLKNLEIQRVPKIYDCSCIDGSQPVTDKDAIKTMRELALREGIMCGPSSGAALYAAMNITKICELKTNIVVIFPDRGQNYLTSGVW